MSKQHNDMVLVTGFIAVFASKKSLHKKSAAKAPEAKVAEPTKEAHPTHGVAANHEAGIVHLNEARVKELPAQSASLHKEAALAGEILRDTKSPKMIDIPTAHAMAKEHISKDK